MSDSLSITIPLLIIWTIAVYHIGLRIGHRWGLEEAGAIARLDESIARLDESDD